MMSALVFIVIEALAMIVPTKSELVPSVAELVTRQNTLQGEAPLMRFTLLLEAVIKVESGPVLKTQTALESPPGEVDAVRRLVKSEMENVYRLEVPLVVDTGAGPNWREAK